MIKSQLASSNLFKIIKILESENFQIDGIRYKKNITYVKNKYKTKKPKKESFPLYVDLIVNSYPSSYTDIVPQYFFEEPLIELIYDTSKYQVNIPSISKNIFMPTPEILSAIKIRCILSRKIHHKRVKDLCDLYSLLFYTKNTFEKNVNELKKFITSEKVLKLKTVLDKKAIKESETILGEPAGSIDTVLKNLFNKF